MKLLLSLAFLFSTLALVACDNSSSTTEPAATPAAAGPVSVTITANDTMKFDKTAFSVNAGQPVKITLKNVGKMPKQAMGHNLIILSQGESWKEFDEAAAKAGADADYFPQDLADKVIAHIKLLGPGESDTIEFTAPTEKGAYPFLCSFPGHAIAGMNGLMTVK